ncbi:hypothetical protein BOX15_Mlig017771g1 [Macrostomum lignano]|uniref:Folate receptor-like domain-containing protein n=1 Tax=Macrostomum lignano TaxID=282301 RepID=A0A267GXH9_9PLAT|nr:hypothetical protein BOX15_Mlig017771g4 [Macrostomum lignano]PAA90740.1 hypothetical protein BOX15_Mlig017771g2 [Macrostomum lignano]PAA90743.1 hypothetical protein BOX15_Mlig017771g1 [Macrostomum lignano]
MKLLAFCSSVLIFRCALALEEITISEGMVKAAQQEEDQKTHKATKSKCTFFAGTRYSVPESSLVNCYWYNRNACCKRIEVTSVFSSLLSKLEGQSRRCYDMLRYLLCYFCSPEQHFWFRDNKVFVCKSFCDDIYSHCRSAVMNGLEFGKAFKNGEDFCRGNNFAVQEDNVACFAFDPTQFDGAASLRPWLPLLLLAAVCIIVVQLTM